MSNRVRQFIGIPAALAACCLVRAMLELAREKGMRRVTASICLFNTQSQKMFSSPGYSKTGEAWYTLGL